MVIVLKYAAIPFLATLLGGAWAQYRRPGAMLRSSTQHFAAGLIFAVVAVELLPDVLHAQKLAVMSGFAAGVGLMMLLKALLEPRAGSIAGLLVAVGIDILVDGILIGTGFAAGPQAGRLLGMSLGIEGVSLGLATSSSLPNRYSSKFAMLILLGLSSLFLVGASAGATVLGSASKTTIASMLSFGSAALMYLVTEELLREAHSTKEAPWVTAMFFAGFGSVELIKLLET